MGGIKTLFSGHFLGTLGGGRFGRRSHMLGKVRGKRDQYSKAMGRPSHPVACCDYNCKYCNPGRHTMDREQKAEQSFTATRPVVVDQQVSEKK